MGKTKEGQSYPTDLTDKQREAIEPLFTGTRTDKWSKRECMNAVPYLVDSGCKWRQLPHDFPPYSTVRSFYRRARLRGLRNRIMNRLATFTRKSAGRNEDPTSAMIDPRDVKPSDPVRNADSTGEKRKDASGIS